MIKSHHRTVFYVDHDRMVSRTRDGGRYTPEIFHEDKTWTPYPELDRIHDGREVEPDEALAAAREYAGDDSISMDDLEAVPGTAGDLSEGVRAPLRP